jgi:hypothetical protein
MSPEQIWEAIANKKIIGMDLGGQYPTSVDFLLEDGTVLFIAWRDDNEYLDVDARVPTRTWQYGGMNSESR